MPGTTEMPPAPAVAPGTPAVRPAPRLHFIDGLRGLAMLMVLLYHCRLFGGLWSVGPTVGGRRFDVAPLLGFGHIGVNLFLVLSGFCLYWPFVKDRRRREPTLWEFAKKRCRRILPPYYVTLLLFSGVPLMQAWRHHTNSDPHYTLNWLLLHALMLHNTRPRYVLTINGSLWSLALEFQLYILFPVLVEAYRRFNPRGVLLIVLLVCTAYRFFSCGNTTCLTSPTAMCWPTASSGARLNSPWGCSPPCWSRAGTPSGGPPSGGWTACFWPSSCRLRSSMAGAASFRR